MSVRRSFLLPFVALLALVALVAGACSSDDSSDGDKKETTTTAKASDSESDSGSDSTETTEAMSDDDFSAAIETAMTALDDANGDPCKLMDTFQSLGSTMGNPTNTEQRKQTTELALAFYTALADAAPDELSAEAEQVRTSVKAIEKEGEETNWSEEFMTEPEAVKNDSTFTESTTAILTKFTEQCSPTSTTAAP